MFRLVDFDKGSTALMSCYYLEQNLARRPELGLDFIILVGSRRLNGLERNKAKYSLASMAATA